MHELRGSFRLFTCHSAEAYTQKLAKQLSHLIVERKKELQTRTNLSSYEENELAFLKEFDNKGILLGKARAVVFDDEEMDVLLDEEENVRDKDVFLVQCPYNTIEPYGINKNVMESFVFIDALRRAKARSITLISLYYPYARGDKQHGKDGIPAKLLATLYQTAGMNNLITMDLHADQIIGFFNPQLVRVENLHATPLIIHYLQKSIDKEARIAAPDAGAAKRAQYLAKALNKRMIMAYKRRNYEKKHTIDELKILGLPGKDEVVIIDDMVASGGSVITLMNILKEKGVKKVSVACTHPLLIGKAIDRFDKLHADPTHPFQKVIGTDSIPHNKKLLDKPWYVELDTSRFIAKAIYEIHTSGSLTPLHKPDCVKKFDLSVHKQ